MSIQQREVLDPATAYLMSNLMETTLKEGTATTTGARSRSTTRDVLVVIEIALALVLLVGAGLLFNSCRRVRSRWV